MKMKVRMKLEKGAPLPKHAKPGDAGLDLTARERVVIAPHETVMVGTGVSAEIPKGCVGLCFPRSGLASKRGITLANCVGVIDSGYRGEIMAPLHNISNKTQVVEVDERVFQLVVIPYYTCECIEVEELGETDRGTGGFGSSGRW